MNTSYTLIRERYRPARIKLLLIAESPPPDASVPSSRHFYRADRVRRGDRLFTNTMWALYPETADLPESKLEAHKETWLRRFESNGYYMIEALEESQPHEVTKQQRQARIAAALPRLLKRVDELAGPHTKIVLIKSNVYEVAAGPLRQAGFAVLNHELVDYPGRFNQADYRRKLSALVKKV